MIFSAQDLRTYVVADTLHYLDEWSQSGENLLVGTAIQESGLGFCLKSGVRLGIYHLSPSHHRSIWGLAGQRSFIEHPHRELLTNLRYATAIAWCVYQKAGCKLPAADNIEALGETWFRHFHRKPTGRAMDFVRNYRELGSPNRINAA